MEISLLLMIIKKRFIFPFFFEESYKLDEKIYADFISVDRILMWQLKTSEEKVDKDKIIKILMMILKSKYYTKSEKKYFAENMLPLFIGSNFEKIQKKYI